MKYNFLFCLILLSGLFKSQKFFNVEYEADYKLTFKDQNTTNATVQEATFALLMNNGESYFKNLNKYVSDSLKLEKKLNDQSNYNDFLKYYTPFEEYIGITSGKIYVTVPISSKGFRYEETNNFDWKLLNEYKKIGKYNCQKAIVKKYGRTWIAYFTNEIPLPFGPYKFNKLPGLILEVSDEKKDYIFSLYKFGKRKYVCKSANMNPNAELVQKQKVFDYKRKEIGDPNKYLDHIGDTETRQLLIKKSSEKAKKYNPIELTL